MFALPTRVPASGLPRWGPLAHGALSAPLACLVGWLVGTNSKSSARGRGAYLHPQEPPERSLWESIDHLCRLSWCAGSRQGWGPLEGRGVRKGKAEESKQGAVKPADQTIFLCAVVHGNESFSGPEKGELLSEALGWRVPAENHRVLMASST